MSEKQLLEIQNKAFSIEFERAIRELTNKYISATTPTSATITNCITTTKNAEATATPLQKKSCKHVIK